MSRSQPHPARDTGSQIGRRPQPRLGAILAAAGALAGLSLVVSSCKKDPESLVVVALTAAPDDTALDSVRITAGSVTQTFALPQGLSSTAISFGMYLPSSIAGSIDVRATATAAGEPACSGYLGTSTTFVIAGGTSNADIALQPGNTCTTGADGGAGGSSGHGSSPPSLAHCTEYDHDLTPSATCATGDGTAADVEISDIGFSPDGKLLFTAGEDGRVKVWTWDGTTLAAEGHEFSTSGGFTKIAVSPDGKLVAAGSTGGSLTVWNVGGSWMVAANLTGITADVNAVTFSPNSQILYAGDQDGNLFTYAETSLAPASMMLLRTATSPFSLTTSTTASDGSSWLGIGYGDGNAGLIHVVGGALGAEIPFTLSSNNLAGIYTMQFSPDGTSVETGAQDGSFAIWSVPLPTPATPRLPKIALTTDFVFGGAFHPGGALIAIGAGGSDADRQLGIWTVATGAVLSTVSTTSLTHRPTAVAFTPDGTTLAAGEHSCGKIIVCAD
jgi:dipeptidyl aminopeptidase/acylaminoacyl peptidase